MNDSRRPGHPPGGQVLVEVSGCSEGDAQAVFEALRDFFPSDRGAADTPHRASDTHPTVWAATFDVQGGPGTAGRRRLTAPVTVDVHGGYHAVDQVRDTLAAAFAVEVVGSASGDQENELQLRLESG
ncbi:hypothetical protein GCM10018793_11960 [Streptomyces sulfonofaciens]|uniref:Uncharacterized protein n=1 Tax=Streptomyces sulfonofaciens TaxID=68272 RepID=A0A919KUV9_9ACTN|nr:hypothetical protein [Streptomyces sulfonofaciens]GHH73347.1 hypothetical protein GCM10018793_11960 [Streptomyces sulfonofaciens]